MRLTKFDGSFPMAEEVNESQIGSEEPFPSNEPTHKMPHQTPPQELVERKPKKKNDLGSMPTFEPHFHVIKEDRKSLEPSKKQKHKHQWSIRPKPGDLVWVHFGEKALSSKCKVLSKIMECGPYEVLKGSLRNEIVVKLPGMPKVSTTFKLSQISPCYDDEEGQNLRSNSFQQGEFDESMEGVHSLAPLELSHFI